MIKIYRRFDSGQENGQNVQQAVPQYSQNIQRQGTQQAQRQQGQQQIRQSGQQGQPQQGQQHMRQSGQQGQRQRMQQQTIQTAKNPTSGSDMRQNGNFIQSSASKQADNILSGEHSRNHRQSNSHPRNGLSGLLQKFLPPAVYDRNTKKIFGLIGAEDLLLLALIFLFMEKDDEENSLLVLALAFVLLSDYIDLPGLDLKDFGI